MYNLYILIVVQIMMIQISPPPPTLKCFLRAWPVRILRLNHLLLFNISSSGPESPPSVLTPELSSDFIYHKKGSNWRTAVFNANSIIHKKA